MGRRILEREHELAVLRGAVREAMAGNGSIVLIAGEAGIGKSSVVDAGRSVLPVGGRLLIGYCDDLATPRVLGPLRDLTVGAVLDSALESGDHSRVLDAIRAGLDRMAQPTMLVIEDVHWVDEATAEILRVLVRRIDDLPVVLVLTYRDEEITADHPMHPLLAATLGARRLHRLRLARLSVNAVRRLGAHAELDPDRVFQVTLGNPFFVTEILASGQVGDVPRTIVEAVRARLAALDDPTRDALERLAVVPSAVERWLVEAVVPGGLATLAPAEQRGVLNVTPDRISFRHELMRRAITDSTPSAARVLYNRAVLAPLLARRDGVDLSRILHHAAEGGHDAAIIEYGPVAAREAVAAGSHREAAAHYRLVLDHRLAFPASDQADLLEGYAIECHTLGLADLARQAQADCVTLRRGLGDPRALGRSLRWLSRMYWWVGARPEAEASGAEAVKVLEGAGDEQALALALSNQSQLHVLAGRASDAIAHGQRAVAIAREVNDAGLLSHALNNVGFAYWDEGQPRGRTMLEESLAVALDARSIEHACRAYVNIVWHLFYDLQLDEAQRFLDTAIELADEAEFLGFLRYLQLTQGMLNLIRGRWNEVESEAAPAAADAAPILRCPALAVLGRLRIRRGQPGGEAMVAEALEMALRLAEPQRVIPAVSALAEAGWLRGDMSDVRPALEDAHRQVGGRGSQAETAELGYWLQVAGVPRPMSKSDHPYALLAAGRWQDAAERWGRAGCPYEHAAALARSPDPSDLLTVLTTLDALGAEPLARQVRQRLRQLGITRIPRGPALATRDNPAQLTQRQVEVARLLADGLSNAEIATRLVVSIRTVDTHVSAVLAKLDVRTRREAAARVRELGLSTR